MDAAMRTFANAMARLVAQRGVLKRQLAAAMQLLQASTAPCTGLARQRVGEQAAQTIRPPTPRTPPFKRGGHCSGHDCSGSGLLCLIPTSEAAQTARTPPTLRAARLPRAWTEAPTMRVACPPWRRPWARSRPIWWACGILVTTGAKWHFGGARCLFPGWHVPRGSTCDPTTAAAPAPLPNINQVREHRVRVTMAWSIKLLIDYHQLAQMSVVSW